MQSFFRSASVNDCIEKIRFEFLNFDDLTTSIDMHQFQIVIPKWFKLEMDKAILSKSKNKRDRDDDNDQNPGGHRKSTPVINSVDPACKLDKNEVYRFVFHKDNMSGLSIPKVNGIDLCLKYHIEGRCKSGCSRAPSHTKLDNQKMIALRKFVSAVKENYNKFRANKKNQKSSNTEIANATGGEEKSDGE